MSLILLHELGGNMLSYRNPVIERLNSKKAQKSMKKFSLKIISHLIALNALLYCVSDQCNTRNLF